MSEGVITVKFLARAGSSEGASRAILTEPFWTGEPGASTRELLRIAQIAERQIEGGLVEFRGIFQGPTYSFLLTSEQVAEIAELKVSFLARLKPASAGPLANPVVSQPVPRVYVQFSLTGKNFDPDAVTDRLGITPDGVFRSGDKIGRSRLSARLSGWEIGTAEVASWNFDSQLSEVLTRLSLKARNVPRVAEEFRIAPRFEFVAHFTTDPPLLRIPAPEVLAISRLGAGLWLDLIQVDRLD